MSLSTYAELQTAIATWLRPGTASTNGLQIGSYIQLFEARANRRLRLRVMESDESVTATTGSRYIAIPAGYIDPIALYLTDLESREELAYRLPTQIDVCDDNGRPEYWAIDGTNIAFDRPAESDYPVTFRMLKRFALSDASPTNWLLTTYPDVYLYGSLLNAAPYVRDAEMLPVWKSLVEEAFAEIENAEARAKGKAPLLTEWPVSSTRLSILRG